MRSKPRSTTPDKPRPAKPDKPRPTKPDKPRPTKPDKPRPTKPDALTQKLLEELAGTLDLENALKKLKITREEAKRIFRGLIPGAVVLSAGKKTAAGGVLDLYVDGASRGNPGESGAGVIIKGPNGAVLKRLRRYLGVGTNNRAEYSAVILALQAAQTLKAGRIRVFADSELVVRQLSGVYKVRSEELRPLYDRVKRLLTGFEEYKITHIPREKNAEADGMANEAIDSRG